MPIGYGICYHWQHLGDIVANWPWQMKNRTFLIVHCSNFDYIVCFIVYFVLQWICCDMASWRFDALLLAKFQLTDVGGEILYLCTIEISLTSTVLPHYLVKFEHSEYLVNSTWPHLYQVRLTLSSHMQCCSSCLNTLNVHVSPDNVL